MSDLTAYRQQVTEYGKRASAAEEAKHWEEAYSLYMQALDVFMHLIKCRQSIDISTYSILLTFYS